MRRTVTLPALALLPACFGTPSLVDCANGSDDPACSQATDGVDTDTGATTTGTSTGSSGPATTLSTTSGVTLTGDNTDDTTQTGSDSGSDSTGSTPPDFGACGVPFSPLVGSFTGGGNPGHFENAAVGVTFDPNFASTPSFLSAGTGSSLLSDPEESGFENRIENLIGTIFLDNSDQLLNRATWEMDVAGAIDIIEEGPVLTSFAADLEMADDGTKSTYTLVADGRLIRQSSWHHSTGAGDRTGYLVNYVALDYASMDGFGWGPNGTTAALPAEPAPTINNVLFDNGGPNGRWDTYVCGYVANAEREFVGFATFGPPGFSGVIPEALGGQGSRVTASHAGPTSTLALQVDWAFSGTVTPNIYSGNMLTFVGRGTADARCGCMPEQHEAYIAPPQVTVESDGTTNLGQVSDLDGDGFDEGTGAYGFTVDGGGTLELSANDSIPTLLLRVTGTNNVTGVSIDGDDQIPDLAWAQQPSMTPVGKGDDTFVLISRGLAPGETLRVAYEPS